MRHDDIQFLKRIAEERAKHIPGYIRTISQQRKEEFIKQEKKEVVVLAAQGSSQQRKPRSIELA
jgi:hypothetical protein